MLCVTRTTTKKIIIKDTKINITIYAFVTKRAHTPNDASDENERSNTGEQNKQQQLRNDLTEIECQRQTINTSARNEFNPEHG